MWMPFLSHSTPLINCSTQCWQAELASILPKFIQIKDVLVPRFLASSSHHHFLGRAWQWVPIQALGWSNLYQPKDESKRLHSLGSPSLLSPTRGHEILHLHLRKVSHFTRTSSHIYCSRWPKACNDCHWCLAMKAVGEYAPWFRSVDYLNPHALVNIILHIKSEH